MNKPFNIHDWQAKQRLTENDSFGSAGTDKRTGQVIGDILQLIKSTGIDPEEVIEAINLNKMNFKNSGLPKMDPDNWGFSKSGMEEMSTTGTGASFNAGSGEGYMSPNAFKKKNKKD